MNVYEKLMNIQAELNVPKSNYNEFGKYHYRSCEDILEALKPLLKKYKVSLILSDEVVQIGDRYYIQSTATLIDAENEVSPLTGQGIIKSIAYAREDEQKKGMDASQLTGSTSSYARKYALNGLFAIDDTKDSDATNKHDTGQTKKPKEQTKKTDDTENDLASEKQLKCIYALAKQKNYSSESMASYIKEVYGKNSSKELTKKEASELIEMLNEIKG